MTIMEASKLTGYRPHSLAKMCTEGIIPSAKKIKGGKWDISEDDIPMLQELYRTAPKRMASPKRMRHGVEREITVIKTTDFGALMKKLDSYNKEHGTSYSYGEATRRGII